jgi:hypothetical protein
VINPWLALTLNTMRLGFEAQNVIALRMARLASGGTRGQVEARRMIAEKVAAMTEAQTAAFSAVIAGRKDVAVAGKVLRVYKKHIRANRRRLS